MVANLSRLVGCNVYISEGRNVQLIRRLENLCNTRRQVALANTFIDEPYNRTGLTLVATCLRELAATVTAVAQQAVVAIDLRDHVADHPRLGVVDHVSLHPLGPEATLQLAAAAARDIGKQLAAQPTQLPVYYYGSAHAAGRELAEIRRKLGYFKSNLHHKPLLKQQQAHDLPDTTANATTTTTTSSRSSHPTTTTSSSSRSSHPTTTTSSRSSSSSSSQPTTTSSSSSSSSQGDWAGSISLEHLSSFPPDAGPLSAPPAAGVVTIGAVPWVVNFNVPLYTDDMSAARAVAWAVSTRGGGLPGVQAMALRHGPGIIEVATNLIQMDWRSHKLPAVHTQTVQSSDRLVDAQLHSQITLLDSSDDDGHKFKSNDHVVERKAQARWCNGHDAQTGAAPEEVQSAVAAAAFKHGLPPPGSGYVTNKVPRQLMDFAAEIFGGRDHTRTPEATFPSS